jgi:hypothetical protein
MTLFSRRILLANDGSEEAELVTRAAVETSGSEKHRREYGR